MSRNQFFPLLAIAVAIGGVGCATHADRLRNARQEFYSGNLEPAAQTLDEQIERGGRDADVFKLDRAIVYLAAGQPKEAERLLLEVRDRFDLLEQQVVGESALSMATDDNRLPYAGEDYEKVLIRSFLALSNLMTDGSDVVAYCWQIADKQQQIARQTEPETPDPSTLSHKHVALGAYLYGAIREETHVNYDDAERAYAQVVSWEPTFRSGAADLQRVRNGHHSAPGNGVLYVITLVGRGPYKEEVSQEPTSAALLIADRILSATGKHTLPPTIAPVKVPQIVLARNEVSGILVSVDGQTQGVTETITDIGNMAVAQHAAIYPRLVARAVVRRVVKKSMIYAGKDMLGERNGSLMNLAMDMTGVVWEATESADTRSWGLLPDNIQVIRMELPSGPHQVSLQPLSNQRAVGAAETTLVTIDDGRNTYVLANFPGSNHVGKVLASGASSFFSEPHE